MRPSPLKHPVAILRKVIGLGQKELADLCNCSTRTIQAVELVKLPLSESLATRIARATGARLEWLLAGDVSVPPTPGTSVTPFFCLGEAYTKDVFERHRALVESPVFKHGGKDAIAAMQDSSSAGPKHKSRPKTMNARSLEPMLDWLLGGDQSPQGEPSPEEEDPPQYGLSRQDRANFESLMEKAKSGQSIPLSVAKYVMLTFEEYALANSDEGLVEGLENLLKRSRSGPDRDVIRWRVHKFLTDLMNPKTPKSKRSKRNPQGKARAPSPKHAMRPQD
jgi:DNA-binding XRE family transcriptional regulator